MTRSYSQWFWYFGLGQFGDKKVEWRLRFSPFWSPWGFQFVSLCILVLQLFSVIIFCLNIQFWGHGTDEVVYLSLSHA